MQAAQNIPDRGESQFSTEPLLPAEQSPRRAALNDLALTLATESAALRAAIPPPIRTALADMVRAMNCYYSNLIEGHHTHPVDIERALAGDYSQDTEKRDLQLEARAHIAVQGWIDAGGLRQHPMDPDAICEIHRRFCADLPLQLLTVTDPKTGEAVPVLPGQLRDRDVQVGRHVAPSPGSVLRLLAHMHKTYAAQGRLAEIVGTACAHHRLVWVHPFADLNGRVARMVSHALLLDVVQSGGLWSVSRGLARREGDYKRLLMAADEPRQGDRDGRGTLSESRLADFAAFFLETAIDQVAFMAKLIEPTGLRARIIGWTAQETGAGRLPRQAGIIMQEVLYRGQIERAELPALLGLQDRMARNISAALIETGALASDSPRAPLRLNFPARLAGDWMPGLFPAG